MPNTPLYSLIFVNYGSARYLAEAIQSIQHTEDLSRSELIVVNNDPNEYSVIHALSRIFGFIVIESGQNGGFGKGANLGAAAAQGHIIGFINPDILWTGRSLDSILSLLSDQTIGVAGISLVDSNGQQESFSFGDELTFSRLIKNNLFPIASRKNTSETITTDWVSGGALFMRKDDFSNIGGFDERFFLYFEDMDLCKRMRAFGKSIRLSFKTSITHRGGKSHPSHASQKRYFFESQETYMRKYRPKKEIFALRLLRLLRYGF